MHTAPLLSHEWVSAQGQDRSEFVVMLHGILGRRRNLLGFARRFVSTFPKLSVLLVDHRNHGDSQGFKSPHTLAACAHDLDHLLSSLETKPRSLIGHSFGAGVGLTYAKTFGGLESLWLLDAVPGVSGSPRSIDPDIEMILGALASCSPTSSKAEFGVCMQTKGIRRDLVAWLSMNLVEAEQNLRFRPDPGLAREMLNDFRLNYSIEDFETLGTKLFLVRAERNSQWQGAVFAPLYELVSSGKISVFELPRSGHFVHIDNPQGILDLMNQDFA